MRAVLCLGLSLLLPACDPGVALGARCSFSSECPTPLVCALARCREECRLHRDCPLEARCVITSAGGTCSLPGDPPCDAPGQGCIAGLVCVAGQCANRCESDLSSCSPDSICAVATDGARYCLRDDVDAGDPIDAGQADAALDDAGMCSCRPDAGADAAIESELLLWLGFERTVPGGFEVLGAGPDLGACAGASCPTVVAGGVAGSAARFDGVDDCVAIGPDPSFQPTEYTLSVWYRLDAPLEPGPPYRVFAGKPSFASDDNDYEIFLNGTSEIWFNQDFGGDGDRAIALTPPFLAGTWRASGRPPRSAATSTACWSAPRPLASSRPSRAPPSPWAATTATSGVAPATTSGPGSLTRCASTRVRSLRPRFAPSRGGDRALLRDQAFVRRARSSSSATGPNGRSVTP